MRTYNKKMIKHTRAINVKLSEKQHSDLMLIRKASGMNISNLIRQNIDFFINFYQIKSEFPK
jgi:hypothetical protein